MAKEGISLWDKDFCGEIIGSVSEEPEECPNRARYTVKAAFKVGNDAVDIYVCGNHAKPFREMGKTVEMM